MPTPADPIDLRSDFIVRPAEAALDAFRQSATMPSAFGLREDARERALEARVAALLGAEDALLFPTATMANQTAIALHTQPGDLVLAPRGAHVANSEAGAPAVISGVRIVELNDDEPAPPPSVWSSQMEPADAQRSAVALFVVENTHNRAGGLAIPLAATDAIVGFARERQIRLHLDGARLLHAALALGTEPAALAAGFDTVTISLNKGLGGLIGAALAGRRVMIERAVMLRQRLGGGLRAIAPHAAGTLAALEAWRALARDHRRAEYLAAALRDVPGIQVIPAAPRTNMVLLHGFLPSAEMCMRLRARGVLALPFGPHKVRLVLHRDIDEAAVSRAVAGICAAFAGIHRSGD